MQHPFGVAASATVALALAGIIISCSDPSSPDPLGNPDQAPDVGSLEGGGWNPAVENAGKKAGKIDVCHSGNGKNFNAINVSANATRAHLGDPATGTGGHSNDYRISDLTPCPPPATPGTVQVCKVAGNGIAAGTTYSYVISANGQQKTVTVAAGQCANVASHRVGTDVSVVETAQPNTRVSSLTVSPAGAQVGTSDLAAGRAMVVVGVGVTTLTYTNTSTTAGSLVICKVAGTGVTAGTNFTFAVAGQTATVPAGAAPAGTCSAPLVATAGNQVVTETATPGVAATTIVATGPGGSNALVSSDLATGTATVTLTAGELTRVTYTNAGVPPGSLVICKVAGTGVATGANFTFTVAGQTQTVAAGAAPNGTCGAALTVPAGAAVVTETAVAGTSVSAITGTPAAPTNINLAARSATVQIVSGQETRITFTNVGAAP